MTLFKYFIASLGGFQFGYAIVTMAVSILSLTAHWNLSLAQQSLAVSAFLIGALPGSVFAGSLCNRIGRKRSQQLVAVFFGLGALIVINAPSLGYLILGRILQGFAGGLISVIGPLYLAEVSPASKRGAYVGFYPVAVTFGILFPYALKLLMPEIEWKLFFMLGIIVSLIHWIGFFFLKDSLSAEDSSHSGSYRDLLLKKYRTPLMKSIFLNVFQQITGINAVIYFAPVLFREYGFHLPSLALLSATLIGFINFLVSIVSLLLLDRIGRRPLLIGGLVGMSLSLVMIVGCYLFDITLMKWPALIGILVYVGSFALGIGPITQLVSSELFPHQIRGQGMSFATFINWIFNFIVVATFMHAIYHFSPAGIFSIYAFFSIIAVMISYWSIPETKGIELN